MSIKLKGRLHFQHLSRLSYCWVLTYCSTSGGFSPCKHNRKNKRSTQFFFSWQISLSLSNSVHLFPLITRGFKSTNVALCKVKILSKPVLLLRNLVAWHRGLTNAVHLLCSWSFFVFYTSFNVLASFRRVRSIERKITFVHFLYHEKIKRIEKTKQENTEKENEQPWLFRDSRPQVFLQFSLITLSVLFSISIWLYLYFCQYAFGSSAF